MLALKGYFNGKEFIPLDKAEVKPNQKVIITILDEYISSEASDEIKGKLNAIEELNGLLKSEDLENIALFDEIISKRVSFSREIKQI